MIVQVGEWSPEPKKPFILKLLPDLLANEYIRQMNERLFSQFKMPARYLGYYHVNHAHLDDR